MGCEDFDLDLMTVQVLLINPDPKAPANPPLGLLYVAGALEQAGIEVRVIDMGFDPGGVELERVLSGWKPEIVGITCTTPLYPHARSIAARVKLILPESWVVLGGVHPSVVPEHSLRDSAADIAAVGEGEQLMPALAHAFPGMDAATRVAGAFVKSRGEIVKGPAPVPIQDLDTLPMPARHLVDVERYFHASGHDRIKWSLPQPSLPVIASRGCPYHCTFCASELVHGKKIRLRSVANIRSELEFLISEYGMKGVYFYDDTLTFNVPWLEKLCSMLKELRLKWICGTRLDRVNRQILEMMKSSGCMLISYGIESGDPRMLKEVLKKGLTLELIRENIRLTREVGIGTIANYMLGFPGETEESMRKTIALSREIDSDVAEFSIYMPLPGTELAHHAEQAGRVLEQDLARFDYARPTYSDNSLPPELVKKYHRKAVRGFYLRPRYILRRAAKVRNWRDVKANLLGLGSFLNLWRRSSGH
ncbi:MAG: radical SAM protein [Candidatus Abyssobacteria bacterium SURF_17]|uniref:Radical SAM protein n=1 Tax=Candidatus Abyssobacteria bacterium SURF_17 TaxID=2093361 RepID=A0A419EQP6_9BACT|nr:MAG: radical SAM protein [Candidatus Abyssubacteria bacterium SURF_17]